MLRINCLSGFQSWTNWPMVAGFVLLGRLLRGFSFAAGVRLLLASIPIWRHWRQRYLATA